MAGGDSPAATFGRRFARLMESADMGPAKLIEASGLGETTVYAILGAKLPSPPKPGTVKILDAALKADGALLKCYAECVAKAAVGSWL